MTKISIFFFLFTINIAVAQESFTVIFVEGDIIHKSTQKAVCRGMRLSDQDKLIYSSSSDMIAAISPSKGRIIIQPQIRNAEKNSELVYVVKDIFTPMGGNAMTRSVIFGNEESIRAFFNQNSYLVLLENYWDFNPNTFPLSESSFFFIQYKLKSTEEVINKKLPNINGKVLLAKEALLTVDGERISRQDVSDFELHYIHGENVKKISSIDFYFPAHNELEEELRIIKESGIEDSFSEAEAYVLEAYGNYDKDELKKIYDSLY